MSNFDLVSKMNEAFGNPKGDPNNIDWDRVRRQCRNIFDENCELMVALGADPDIIGTIKESIEAILSSSLTWSQDVEVDVEGVRDALCDVHVFAYGAHHMMGVDADRDMDSVVSAVMSRFVKDEADLIATKEKFNANGVLETYIEGSYPTLVLKSAVDQPDAPKGKFLKAASYRQPTFYDINAGAKFSFDQELGSLIEQEHHAQAALDSLSDD